MRKFTIEIEVDFEKIFEEIPEGLFQKEGKPDKIYEIETIHNCLKNAYLYSLEKTMQNYVKKDLFEYLKHHHLCELQVGKAISEANITPV